MNPERRARPRTSKDEIVTRLLLKLAMVKKLVMDGHAQMARSLPGHERPADGHGA